MNTTEKKVQQFCELLHTLLEHSLAGETRPLNAVLVLNPVAGGFTIKKRWAAHRAALEAALQAAAGNPRRTLRFSVITTRRVSLKPYLSGGDFHLILTAGGDGTHRETLGILLDLFERPQNAALRDSCAVLRLPLGTGNDGADGTRLDAVLARLTAPAHVEKQRALRLTTSTGKGPFRAFNVLSMGLDAFVTHMVNKIKGRLPGDSYKLWVDIAALFYDKIYTVSDMRVTAFDADGAAEDLSRTTLLLAVGASGRRTYGSQKHVLPDDRNVCIVRQMPVFRKVILKERFTDGTHIFEPECYLTSAARLEISSDNAILAQMDGETTLLTPEDFPVVIQLTEPIVPVLVSESA